MSIEKANYLKNVNKEGFSIEKRKKAKIKKWDKRFGNLNDKVWIGNYLFNNIHFR